MSGVTQPPSVVLSDGSLSHIAYNGRGVTFCGIARDSRQMFYVLRAEERAAMWCRECLNVAATKTAPAFSRIPPASSPGQETRL